MLRSQFCELSELKVICRYYGGKMGGKKQDNRRDDQIGEQPGLFSFSVPSSQHPLFTNPPSYRWKSTPIYMEPGLRLCQQESIDDPFRGVKCPRYAYDLAGSFLGIQFNDFISFRHHLLLPGNRSFPFAFFPQPH